MVSCSEKAIIRQGQKLMAVAQSFEISNMLTSGLIKRFGAAISVEF
jgi:hypothetical protein